MGNITKELAKYRIMSQFKDKNSCLSYLMLQPGKPKEWMKERDFICSEFELMVHVENIKKTDEFMLTFIDYDKTMLFEENYIDLSSISETDEKDVYLEKITFTDDGVYFELKSCHFYGLDYEFGLEQNETIDGSTIDIALNMSSNKFKSQRFDTIQQFTNGCSRAMNERDARYVFASTSSELQMAAKKAKWIKDLSNDARKRLMSYIRRKPKDKGNWYMNSILRTVHQMMRETETQRVNDDVVSFCYVRPGERRISWTYEENEY